MEDPELEIPTPDERRAQQAVRELSTARPDAEFRAHLREQLVSGDFGPARPRVLHLPWHRRPMTHWTLASAAAVAIVAALLVWNQGPEWHVISAHGEGIAVVDGRPVPLGHTTDLDALFRPGVRVMIPEGSEVELRAGDVMLAQIASGSDVTVPSLPGRWFARRAIGEVRSGEIRLTTGAGFHGATLALQTPDAQVRVTGTTLAVICESAGTCVCVLEGRVHVGASPRTMEAVTGGTRGYVFADGRPMLHEAMRADEVPRLTALRDSRAGLLGPPR